jgi:1-acyl-sn-glycerol-3-phosphate acyltransferase
MSLRPLFRQIVRVAGLSLLTVALLPFQIAAVACCPALARRIPVLYHRLGCRILGLRVRIEGAPAAARPLLIVSNHISWLDIPLLTAVMPVSFVAKREVGSWPVFGLLAKLQRSIFVDRARRRQSAAANGEIAARLLAGDAIVLFAEGTSSDGRDVLPFRSALIGSAAQACERLPAGEVFVQPLSVSYTGGARDLAPWHGDMELLPHFVRVLRAPGIDAVLRWGEPAVYFAQSDRKRMARKLEDEVRALTRGAAVQSA